MIEARIEFDNREMERFRKFPSDIVSRVMPKALELAAKPIKEGMKQKLPDSDKTGTREKMSRSAKARWPHKLNQQVTHKRIEDSMGMAIIIGVNQLKGSLVNIDFGEKAYTEGRRHVLWDSKGERTHSPEFRVQKNDIANQLVLEHADQAGRVILKEINDFIERNFG